MWRRTSTVMMMFAASITATSKDDTEVAKHRSASKQKLQTLVIAMHNYHLDFTRLPAHAMYDKSNKQPLLSWRVTMLPYLGHKDLFKKFKLDEPWDSENNKALLKEMPSIFEMPGMKNEPGMTCYQVFTMPMGQPTPGKYTYQPIFPLTNSKLTLGQLTVQDGTSNTICIAEASTPVEWTKPVDLLMSEKDDAPLPKLGARADDDAFQVAMADGSVIQVRKTIPNMKEYDLILKSMIGRRDGYVRETSLIIK